MFFRRKPGSIRGYKLPELQEYWRKNGSLLAMKPGSILRHSGETYMIIGALRLPSINPHTSETWYFLRDQELIFCTHVHNEWCSASFNQFELLKFAPYEGRTFQGKMFDSVSQRENVGPYALIGSTGHHQIPLSGSHGWRIYSMEGLVDSKTLHAFGSSWFVGTSKTQVDIKKLRVKNT